MIENDLNKEIFILNKKINYLKAIDFVTVDFNLDSAIVYLKLNYDEDNSLKDRLGIESKELDEFISSFCSLGGKSQSQQIVNEYLKTRK